jgi:hypothetical protein
MTTIKEQLLYAVVKFMKDTLYCYNNTTYTSDRSAYASDIVLCAHWVADILGNVDVNKIIANILDTSTSKHILDYYKQGKLGDEQAKSFVNMQTEIERLETGD